jgi:cytochrome c-type biogenesis protein CcmE
MRSKRRLYFILFVLGCIFAGAGLALFALRDAVSYFYMPHEVKDFEAQQSAVTASGHVFRIGGLVEKGTLTKPDKNLMVRFTITDTIAEQRIQYTGILPDLFREGQGVVAKGALDDKGLFIATELLAKHDEKYMPPEVAKGLKKAHEQMKNGQVKP